MKEKKKTPLDCQNIPNKLHRTCHRPTAIWCILSLRRPHTHLPVDNIYTKTSWFLLKFNVIITDLAMPNQYCTRTHQCQRIVRVRDSRQGNHRLWKHTFSFAQTSKIHAIYQRLLQHSRWIHSSQTTRHLLRPLLSHDICTIVQAPLSKFKKKYETFNKTIVFSNNVLLL